MASLVIHLVHGTQFYLWRKPRIGWVEDDGAGTAGGQDQPSFRAGLRKRLEEKGHTVDFDVIPWSGRNRHGARLEAARDIRKRAPAGADPRHHFLIAHSHGGNACMLAFRDDEEKAMSGFSGVACLATPFLIVREAGWALAATTAWLTLTALGACFAIQHHVKPAVVAFVLSVLAMSVGTIPLFIVLRRYKNVARWIQAPPECPVPVAIMRCPADEASSSLGFVGILARIIYQMEHLAAWPLRMLKKHPVRLWMISCVVMISLVIAIAKFASISGWLESAWPWILVVLLGPWWLGLPLRLVIYGLAYGIDMFGLPLVHLISAEVTPIGHYDTWLVATPDSEKLRAAHSEIYELPRVQELLANWFDDRVTAGPPRVPATPR